MSQCRDYIVTEGDPSLYYCLREENHKGPHRAEIEWVNESQLSATRAQPVTPPASPASTPYRTPTNRRLDAP